jgi:hypothetical protein
VILPRSVHLNSKIAAAKRPTIREGGQERTLHVILLRSVCLKL